MSRKHPAEFRELPLEQIQEDPNQPRETFNTDGDKNRLVMSIKALGIKQPLAVTQVGENDFVLCDGHRRYRCAKELGLETVPCLIYPKLDPGDLAQLRFELQSDVRQWKPLERSAAFSTVKEAKRLSTNKELANHLFVSETLISRALSLSDLKAEYKDMMDKYGLTGSYVQEFVRLKDKLRPIKEFSIDEIIENLFQRVQHRVIKSSKDFRTMGRIFLRATANHNYIHAFLKNPDMTVKELEQNTIQSGFSLWIEQVIKKVGEKQKDKTPFSSQEKVLLTELQKVLDKNI